MAEVTIRGGVIEKVSFKLQLQGLYLSGWFFLFKTALRDNSHIIRFTDLKSRIQYFCLYVHRAVHSHHHNLILEHFGSPERSPVPIGLELSPPLYPLPPKLQAITDLLFLPLN